MNRGIIRSHPLLLLALGTYLLYCLGGIALMALPLGVEIPGTKTPSRLIFFYFWPYPMLRSLGWRVNPEAMTTWLIADAVGAILVATFALLGERLLGPERRVKRYALVGTMVGWPTLLIMTELAVALAFRT